MLNLYDVVGVARDSSSELIRNRILLDREQLLILVRIPRRAPDAQARIAQLDEAERILLNPQLRAEYDSRGYAEENTTPSIVPSTKPSVFAETFRRDFVSSAEWP